MATDRVYKRMKVDLNLRSNDHEDPILLHKHKIFLSHSGAREMHFVEKLCEDLESQNRFPFCDKRPSSLPKGENFLNLIEDVMAQIDMMVVVVSDEYFTSKWPMIELHVFMEASAKDPKLKILPLFWGLNVHEFCDPHRQKRWFEVWEKMAIVDVQIKVEEWKQSLNLINPSLYGLVYINQDSKYGEVAYREEIVSNICNTIPSYINLLDGLNVQSRSHLCQVVLENILDLAKIQGVRVMGLYGQDHNEGLGKTQICKNLCYEWDSKFEGKVCHVELGKQSEHELLKKVLTTLTNPSMLEVVQEMGKKECRNILFNEIIWKEKIFLMIDNVRDDQVDSLMQANMLLRAPFVKGSLMIVTSRFKNTLRSLNIDEIACLHVSKLERELLSLDVTKRILDRGKRKLDTQMSRHWMDKEPSDWETPVLNLENMSARDPSHKQYFTKIAGDFNWRFENLSELEQPECTTRIQSHSQSPPSSQTRRRKLLFFKPDKNKEFFLSPQIQTENVEPLSEGRTSDVTMSVEELQLIPQMIQPMHIRHDPTSCNEGSKESSSQLLSSFLEELHKLTRSLSLRKVPTVSKQSANLTLDQFLDNHYLHNPGAMLIAGRVQVSNRQSVQFVFKDGKELAKVVGVGCFGQKAVVIITKSLKVQVVHDEDAWRQIWNEARTGGSSSQFMTFLKNSRSHSTVDDVTTLGNLSSQKLAKQFGIGLECDSHLQASVKVHHQEKGRREFLILMFARFLLLDKILETKCHDDNVEAFEKNILFCDEYNALRKSANLPDGVSSGEWIWTSTLWENLWNYLPSLVKNVGNAQLGTGRGGIGDGGHGIGGDGGDGGGDRDDSPGGDGVLPLPPQDLDLENDGFAVVEVYPGYGGHWDNKDLVDKDLQDSTITPTLTFHFEKSKQRRELNVVLCVRFDLGEVVGPKSRDEDELRFGWFHDNLRISLQSSDDDAAFLKPDHQVVNEPDISTTTSSTSSSITSNPFHVSLEAPGCSRSSPSSLFAMMGTLGISKDLKSRNTQVMEMTSQLINKQVFGGFHYQDRSTENKNSKLAFRYVFPSIPKDRVIHDDTTRNIYMLSGLCTTVSPTVKGTWHQLNMSEASPYTFHSSRRFNEILASKKRMLLKDCKSFEQTYDLKLHINHAMTHIYEYIERPQRLKGGESCNLLKVGNVQEG